MVSEAEATTSQPASGPTTRVGGCLCGAVRYEITGDPFLFNVCHCNNCKKMSGSAFMANVFFNVDQFRIVSGQSSLNTYADTSTMSGNTLSRTFCSTCGSPVTLVLGHVPTMVVLPVGCVEDTYHWRPHKEIFCGDKLGWVGDVEGAQKEDQG
ncbi:hypothetical protein JAAARDRAFT_39920 [Jaapia argillacea MUCL 33604]|uniref:CENP-V/GFA domain-containing protein n=1 Tax=Jaapia argillacea MUCL 33604 TaxID=933084 RepID=A0A067PFN5_9AGAM|nr:hypothetical protein JAAARDRAFT_39920 [Jaapia argillacea MUCL 33604]